MKTKNRFSQDTFLRAVIFGKYLLKSQLVQKGYEQEISLSSACCWKETLFSAIPAFKRVFYSLPWPLKVLYLHIAANVCSELSLTDCWRSITVFLSFFFFFFLAFFGKKRDFGFVWKIICFCFKSCCFTVRLKFNFFYCRCFSSGLWWSIEMHMGIELYLQM